MRAHSDDEGNSAGAERADQGGLELVLVFNVWRSHRAHSSSWWGAAHRRRQHRRSKRRSMWSSTRSRIRQMRHSRRTHLLLLSDQIACGNLKRCSAARDWSNASTSMMKLRAVAAGGGYHDRLLKVRAHNKGAGIDVKTVSAKELLEQGFTTLLLNWQNRKRVSCARSPR